MIFSRFLGRYLAACGASTVAFHNEQEEQEEDFLLICMAKSKRRLHKLKRGSFICLTYRSKEKKEKSYLSDFGHGRPTYL